MFVLSDIREGSESESTAQNIILGWILSGLIAVLLASEPSSEFAHRVVLEALDLRRFWEIEDVLQKASCSLETQQCEEHFQVAHFRTSEERYVIRLLFKNGPPVSLGDSRSAFESLPCGAGFLKWNPINSIEYRDFLAEYESLGHMTKNLSTDIGKPDQSYYIPHYVVLHDSSVTTHLRVVFTALYCTKTGCCWMIIFLSA